MPVQIRMDLQLTTHLLGQFGNRDSDHRSTPFLQ